MIVKSACISDIHFGVGLAKSVTVSRRIRKELNQFMNYIRENELHVIHINGDFFDKPLTLKDPEAIMAIDAFMEIANICVEKGIKLRVIHGTEGHESFQTRRFEELQIEGLDLKVFERVAEEELFPDYNVLYIPEETIADADEYYEYYKTKQYALINFHGYWDKMCPPQTVSNTKNKEIKCSPALIYDEWKHALEFGVCACGHLHKRKSHDGKIFYPGSFSAWNFTDLSKRGWMAYEYDTETRQYSVTILDNVECPVYQTVKMDKLNLSENFTVDEFMEKATTYSERYDFLNVELKDVPKNTMELIKGVIKGNPKLSISDKTEAKENKVHESTTVNTHYKYILEASKDASVDSITLRFIKEDLKDSIGADTLTLQDVTEAITKDEPTVA